MKNRLSRAKTEAISEQCIEILNRRGLKKQVNSRLESQYAGYFDEFLQFVGVREILPDEERKDTSNIPTGLTKASLDKLTLELGLVYVRHGVRGVYYTQSLNVLRGSIADILLDMGYRSIERLCSASRSRWDAYPEWHRIARIEGVEK